MIKAYGNLVRSQITRDKKISYPPLKDVIQLTGESGRCQSSTVSTHPHGLDKVDKVETHGGPGLSKDLKIESRE